MFTNLGIDWACSVLGFISAAMIPIPFLLVTPFLFPIHMTDGYQIDSIYLVRDCEHAENDPQRIFEELPSCGLPWHVGLCFVSVGEGLTLFFQSTYKEIESVHIVRRPTRDEKINKRRIINIFEDQRNKQ